MPLLFELPATPHPAPQPAPPPAPELRLTGHVPALDAVRGIAILLVTVFRFTLAAGGEEPPAGAVYRVLALGERGVDLFFVLSGFLITGILYDARGQTGYFRNFYARRTLRIFPLYFGVLFLAFGVLPLVWPGEAVPFAETAPLQGWLWAYAANVYQAWQGAYALGWFNHFWSLAVEEHFYLVWPVVVFLCTRRAAMAVCAGFILLAAGLRAWIITRTGNAVAIDVLTPCRMDALATGGLLALVARGPAGLGGLLRWARPGAVVTGVVLAAVLLSGRTFWFLPLTLWAFFFGAMLIVALGVRPQSWAGRALHGRPLRFLGKYSYGLYVFQNLLIPVVAPVLTLAGAIAAVGSDLGGRLLYLMVMSPAAVAAALLSWHLYEQPFLRLKRFFHGRRVAPAGGP